MNNFFLTKSQQQQKQGSNRTVIESESTLTAAAKSDSVSDAQQKPVLRIANTKCQNEYIEISLEIDDFEQFVRELCAGHDEQLSCDTLVQRCLTLRKFKPESVTKLIVLNQDSIVPFWRKLDLLETAKVQKMENLDFLALPSDIRILILDFFDYTLDYEDFCSSKVGALFGRFRDAAQNSAPVVVHRTVTISWANALKSRRMIPLHFLTEFVLREIRVIRVTTYVAVSTVLNLLNAHSAPSLLQLHLAVNVDLVHNQGYRAHWTRDSFVLSRLRSMTIFVPRTLGDEPEDVLFDLFASAPHLTSLTLSDESQVTPSDISDRESMLTQINAQRVVSESLPRLVSRISTLQSLSVEVALFDGTKFAWLEKLSNSKLMHLTFHGRHEKSCFKRIVANPLVRYLEICDTSVASFQGIEKLRCLDKLVLVLPEQNTQQILHWHTLRQCSMLAEIEIYNLSFAQNLEMVDAIGELVRSGQLLSFVCEFSQSAPDKTQVLQMIKQSSSESTRLRKFHLLSHQRCVWQLMDLAEVLVSLPKTLHDLVLQIQPEWIENSLQNRNDFERQLQQVLVERLGRLQSISIF